MSSLGKSPSVVLPPPSFSHQPFFSPSSLSTSSFFESSDPGSPLCSMERSIRQVMSKFGAGDVNNCALLPSYRSMRRRRPLEDNQAVAVTNDENSYKIMVDVKDFAEGSVSVRAVGENELVVEGIIEKKEEFSPSENYKTSTSCSKKFQQRFMFPGLQVEGVKSTVSSDGVLTVSAPKKSSLKQIKQNVTEIAIESEGGAGEQKIKTILETSDKSSTQKSQNESVSTSTTTVQKETSKVSSEVKSTASDNKTSVSDQQKSVQTIPVSTDNRTTTTSSDSFFNRIFENSLVPIQSKGRFLEDSFFENSRNHYSNAVRDLMTRVSTDAQSSDPLNWYNSFRSSNLMEDTRVGTVSTEEMEYKIVLDVNDFEDGSVNVRAVGESEILVEGKMEKKSEGSSVSKRFRRRFVLPGCIASESITSALSADGVLTITAPKKDNFKLIELKGDNVDISKKSLATSSIFGESTLNTPAPSSVTSPSIESVDFNPIYPVIREDQKETSVMSEASTIDAKNIMSKQTCEQDQQKSMGKTGEDLSSKSERIVEIVSDVSTANNSNEKVVNIDYIDKNQSEIDATDRKISLQKEKAEQYQLIGEVKDLTDVNLKETVKQRKISNQSKNTRDISINLEDDSNFAMSPIVRRGPFYQDSFFSGVQQPFQSAIRQVLDRWVEGPSLLSKRRNDTHSLCSLDRFNDNLSNYRSILDCDFFDDLTCYNTLRHRSLNEESQATSVKENAVDFQIVLDVHGFSEKDLKIRALSHNELVVEGVVQSSSSGSSSSHSFRKQFLLPGQVRMEAVHSALSADDILTITVPKNTLLRITDKGNF